MRVIKSLNNNVALAVDENGEEVVLFGNGVGFPAMPYELDDLSGVHKVFRNVDASVYPALRSISGEVMLASTRIVDLAASRISGPLNPNLPFTLADHLQFAIERSKRGMKTVNPLADEIAFVYPLETAIGRQGLAIMRECTGIMLPRGEASSIGIHLVNAEVEGESGLGSMSDVMQSTKVIDSVINAMENDLGIHVDRSSYSYMRFVMHLRYLVTRLYKGSSFPSANGGMLSALAQETPRAFEHTQRIASIIAEKTGCTVGDDELLYLLMYVNRFQSAG